MRLSVALRYQRPQIVDLPDTLRICLKSAYGTHGLKYPTHG